MAPGTFFALHHGCKLTSLKPEDVRFMRREGKNIFYNKEENSLQPIRGFFSKKIPWISNSSWLGQKEFFLISKEMRRGESKKCPVMPEGKRNYIKELFENTWDDISEAPSSKSCSRLPPPILREGKEPGPR